MFIFTFGCSPFNLPFSHYNPSGQDDIPSSAPSKTKRNREGGKKGKKNEVITIDSDSEDDSSLTKRKKKKTQKSEGVEYSKMSANKTGEKMVSLLDDSGSEDEVELIENSESGDDEQPMKSKLSKESLNLISYVMLAISLILLHYIYDLQRGRHHHH